ncbi:hypothetical protein OG21DRAFT_1208924 [Imleria badia]|nr:hypothetical protein OG21DRAFT_1208924 [Imleria badia]
MFVKGYIVDFSKIDAKYGRTDKKDPHNMGYFDVIMQYIPREAYNYTAFVQDDSGHYHVALVFLEGTDRQKLQDMPMPEGGDLRLLEAAKYVLTPGMWKQIW